MFSGFVDKLLPLPRIIISRGSFMVANNLLVVVSGGFWGVAFWVSDNFGVPPLWLVELDIFFICF
jgi:hypothetical protein